MSPMHAQVGRLVTVPDWCRAAKRRREHDLQAARLDYDNEEVWVEVVPDLGAGDPGLTFGAPLCHAFAIPRTCMASCGVGPVGLDGGRCTTC